MSPLLLAAFVLVVWDLFARPLRAPQFGRGLPRPPAWFVVCAAFGLLAAVAGRLALLVYQAGHDGPRPAFFATLPFAFVDDVYSVYGPGPQHGAISLAALGIALAETAALGTLVLSAFRDPEESLALKFAPYLAGALALMSIFAPVLSSNDVFGYVGLGMLGDRAYAQPAGFFSGEYARLFAFFPIRPTVYGPLWVAINSAVVALGTTLFTKIIALRAFGALLVVALAVVARLLGASRAVQLALLLNPLLWLQFVANAHNDILAILIVAGALVAIVRAQPVVAVLLIAGAGLVKLPFLVLGAAVLGRARSPRMAMVLLAAAALLCLGLSFVFGGHAYLDGLVQTVRLRGHEMSPAKTLLKGVILAFALIATAYTVLRRRYLAFTGWLYPALGPIVFPWYFAWTIPYALASEQFVLPTLLALPIAGTLSDTLYGLDGVAMVLPFAAIAALARALRPSPRDETAAGQAA